MLKKFAQDLLTLKKSNHFSLLVALTVVLRSAKYISLYILLLAVLQQWGIGHRQISLAISFLAFVTAEAAASLPISGLMGFGAYEGAWQAIFAISMVKITAVSSVILAIHLITQVVGYFLGFLALVWVFAFELRAARQS